VENAKDKLAQVDKMLDDYETSIKLPILGSPGEEDELNKYLTMDRDVVERLQPQDCRGIAFRLSQFAFYVQRLHNRESARIPWAKTELGNIIAASPNYDKFVKYDIQIGLIIQENTYAQALQKILTYAEQRATRLNSLSYCIKNLSDILMKGSYAQSQPRENG
jgi:hypothetical protein